MCYDETGRGRHTLACGAPRRGSELLTGRGSAKTGSRPRLRACHVNNNTRAVKVAVIYAVAEGDTDTLAIVNFVIFIRNNITRKRVM